VRGFEFVDSVTSDVTFLARGGTLAEAFAAAADALLAVTLEEPERLGARVRRTLVLEEPDLELLLLRFLNELVYLRDAEQLLLRSERLRVAPGEPARLEAELVGEAIDPARHRLAAEVKAATAHRLRVDPTPEGYELEVTLDV
jgi:SHS2 domain-containing protein